MSATRMKYNLATTGKATQECKLELGPKVPKTEFMGTGARKSSAPMGKGKK